MAENNLCIESRSGVDRVYSTQRSEEAKCRKGEVEWYIRAIDFMRDRHVLNSMLNDTDARRLDALQRAVEARHAFILVAEIPHEVVGLAVVHIFPRDDMGWESDSDTAQFQLNENAYLENLEVREDLRSRGIGHDLLLAVEHAASEHGKRTLWLHSGEWNARAHQFYAREGWQLVRTVYPDWNVGKPTRIYQKFVREQIMLGD